MVANLTWPCPWIVTSATLSCLCSSNTRTSTTRRRTTAACWMPHSTQYTGQWCFYSTMRLREINQLFIDRHSNFLKLVMQVMARNSIFWQDRHIFFLFLLSIYCLDCYKNFSSWIHVSIILTLVMIVLMKINPFLNYWNC